MDVVVALVLGIVGLIVVSTTLRWGSIRPQLEPLEPLNVDILNVTNSDADGFFALLPPTT
jgi:hypothetical protein